MRDDGVAVAAQVSSMPPDTSLLERLDLITTPVPSWVERFRALGVRTEPIRLAFYDAILDRLRARGVDPDAAAPGRAGATFVGGLSPAFHQRRLELVERACREAGLEVWGYGAELLPEGSAIRPLHRGEAWGLGMYEVLARSKIVVNVHGEVAEGYAANMRLFEATGSGALLLTDGGSNLAELFEPGEEVVTYTDGDDLIAKLDRYLADDAERARVAAAGQARTLRDHTYRQRIGELAPLLEEVARG
jgi:hypothetical protein